MLLQPRSDNSFLLLLAALAYGFLNLAHSFTDSPFVKVFSTELSRNDLFLARALTYAPPSP